MKLYSLHRELELCKEHINDNSMLWDPTWINLYEAQIALINLLREKYSIKNGIYVRKS